MKQLAVLGTLFDSQEILTGTKYHWLGGRRFLTRPAVAGWRAPSVVATTHLGMARPFIITAFLIALVDCEGTGNHKHNERPIHPTDRQLRGKCAYFMVMHVALLHDFFLSQKRILCRFFGLLCLS